MSGFARFDTHSLALDQYTLFVGSEWQGTLCWLIRGPLPRWVVDSTTDMASLPAHAAKFIEHMEASLGTSQPVTFGPPIRSKSIHTCVLEGWDHYTVNDAFIAIVEHQCGAGEWRIVRHVNEKRTRPAERDMPVLLYVRDGGLVGFVAPRDEDVA